MLSFATPFVGSLCRSARSSLVELWIPVKNARRRMILICEAREKEHPYECPKPARPVTSADAEDPKTSSPRCAYRELRN